MVKTRSVLLAVLLLLSIGCTTVDYRSPHFEEQTKDHAVVAVLPFETVLAGRQPRRLSPAQILAIEEAESLAFQRALYFRLLNRIDKGQVGIGVQPVEETNRILASRGIAVHQTWGMTPQALADILEVDAVVRTRVEKARYMSDVASLGVDVGLAVLYDATDGKAAAVLPPVLAKTHDIFADSTVWSGSDGALLWRVAVHRETDWTRPANDIIVGVTRKLARKFPYRF